MAVIGLIVMNYLIHSGKRKHFCFNLNNLSTSDLSRKIEILSEAVGQDYPSGKFKEKSVAKATLKSLMSILIS